MTCCSTKTLVASVMALITAGALLGGVSKNWNGIRYVWGPLSYSGPDIQDPAPDPGDPLPILGGDQNATLDAGETEEPWIQTTTQNRNASQRYKRVPRTTNATTRAPLTPPAPLDYRKDVVQMSPVSMENMDRDQIVRTEGQMGLDYLGNGITKSSGSAITVAQDVFPVGVYYSLKDLLIYQMMAEVQKLACMACSSAHWTLAGLVKPTVPEIDDCTMIGMTTSSTNSKSRGRRMHSTRTLVSSTDLGVHIPDTTTATTEFPGPVRGDAAVIRGKRFLGFLAGIIGTVTGGEALRSVTILRQDVENNIAQLTAAIEHSNKAILSVADEQVQVIRAVEDIHSNVNKLVEDLRVQIAYVRQQASVDFEALRSEMAKRSRELENFILMNRCYEYHTMTKLAASMLKTSERGIRQMIDSAKSGRLLGWFFDMEKMATNLHTELITRYPQVTIQDVLLGLKLPMVTHISDDGVLFLMSMFHGKRYPVTEYNILPQLVDINGDYSYMEGGPY